MESIGQALNRTGHASRVNLDDLTNQIMADQAVASFISEHQLSQAEIKRSLPKFNQFLVERRKFQTGDSSYIAKGYEPILTMNEGYADVSYKETKALKQAQAQRAIEDRIHVVSLPKSYKNITFQDVDLTGSRSDVFQYLVNFVDRYPSPNQKGLYIYGDMGIGKSFILAAMAHELSEKKAVETTMLHYPSFVIDIKNAINSGGVKEEIDAVKAVPVLILDDIGAEQTTSWVRDEILQVILQHRMLEELPTFFTSNYSLANLEAKFGNIKGADESWQAKRVMERIRYLAKDVHLLGENRR
ncbi:primosomal protein DnaI [Streptococcus criceti]|uniref:Primosomal protein DnaI n=1 Tax=Streptococcus criceti HS-6 TaxID=873449 RepID=G5JST9_STRCG|nr:primosomal protein DnaI [Streptococcus criceti]EHI73549.1 primosomal protein DnaI [Streptococcus criceti HS-6]SUN37566.1 primosomal protein DnaI [Streptococcus criceti]